MGDKMFETSFEKYLPFTDLCDFTFVVNGKAFKVHRIVFAARSTVFARIFKNYQKEVIFEDIQEEIFAEIVHYMYTGYVHVTDKNDRDLMAAGEKFELKDVILAVQLHRNLKMDPLKGKELENLKIKYDEAKYLYGRTKERYSAKNPFSHTSNRYY